MDADLLKFFQSHKAQDEGNTYTHVLVFEPQGKSYISQRFEDELLQHQQRIAESGAISYVAEKAHKTMPIIVDFDIKYTDEEDDLELVRRYGPEDLKKIVRIYFSVFKELFVDFDENRLVCCVLEKTAPTMTDDCCVKDGFHLHFPFFVIDGDIQKTVIRRKVIEAIKANSDLHRIFPRPEKIIDANVPNVPWLMYGSRKSPEKEPYLLTRVINKDVNEVSFEQIFGNRFIAYHLSIHRATRSTSHLISLRPSEIDMQSAAAVRKLPSSYTPDSRDVSAVLKDAKILLTFMNKSRWDERKTWFDVGACLYNIGNGSPEAYDLWITFSKKSPTKFDESVCQRMWEKDFKPNNRTLGSLVFYARQDNQEGYENWRKKRLRPTVDAALSGTDFALATLLHEMFRDEIVCVSAKQNKWYRFFNHRWQLCDDGIDLELKIYRDLKNRIMERRTQLSQKASQLAEEDTKDSKDATAIEDKIKQCTAVILRLESDRCIKSVVRSSKTLFYERDFVNKLDTNPNLVGFNNGVYDLSTDEFRDGRPDDYVSMCTKTTYIEMTWTDPLVKECLSFILKTFVNPNIRKYALQFIASCWRAKNVNKLFMAWLGAPNSGKSTFNKEVQKCFGDYCASFQTTTFTGKKPAGGAASPDWYRMKSLRLGTLQEPNGDEEINIGTLKELTGNDRFTARPLFGMPEDIEPQMKFYLMCNKVPAIPSNDAGTFERLRILMFESVFVNDPPESEEEQYRTKRFPRVMSIDERLDAFVPAFTWILLQEFKEYRENGYLIPEPMEVMSATLEFRRRNDVMSQFADAHVCKTDNMEDRILFSEFKITFRTWFKVAYPQSKQLKEDELREQLIAKFGKPDGRGLIWKGYKIFNADEAEAEEDDKRSADKASHHDDPGHDDGADGILGGGVSVPAVPTRASRAPRKQVQQQPELQKVEEIQEAQQPLIVQRTSDASQARSTSPAIPPFPETGTYEEMDANADVQSVLSDRTTSTTISHVSSASRVKDLIASRTSRVRKPVPAKVGVAKKV